MSLVWVLKVVLVGLVRLVSDYDSPCKRTCKLDDNKTCLSCFRTIEEIISWRSMSIEDRVIVLNQITSRTTTHNCPSCDNPTYCAMADGKSYSACWCMYEQRVELDYDECLCRCKPCLTSINGLC